MKLRKYTPEQLVDAVDSSVSIRETLIKLNVSPYGGNYEVFKRAVDFYNLDTSHFLGRAANSGSRHKGGGEGTGRPLQDFLDNKHPIQSYKLKNKLLKAKLLEYNCVICGIVNWNNKSIALELDHIDGDNKNNNLKNLRILCPNCHSQTDTFRSKKRKV